MAADPNLSAGIKVVARYVRPVYSTCVLAASVCYNAVYYPLKGHRMIQAPEMNDPRQPITTTVQEEDGFRTSLRTNLNLRLKGSPALYRR